MPGPLVLVAAIVLGQAAWIDRDGQAVVHPDGPSGGEHLFEALGPGAAQGAAGPGETPARRDRPVRIRAEAIHALECGGGAAVANLFDDAALPLEVTGRWVADGSRIVTGRVAGEAGSTFALVTRGDVMQADIRSPRHGAFEVRYAGGGPDPGGWGVHVVRQIDETGYKPCATGPAHGIDAPADEGAPDGAPAPLRGAPVRIDLLVVYTAQARAGAGGQAAIDALIDLAVTMSNQVYANSGIGVDLRLAHRALVNYTESGSASADLAALRGRTDGAMDEVHCMRTAVGADLVALIVNNFDACGIGYLMVGVNSGFAPYGFSVTDKDCIGGYTFTHELGHNMGCHHDRDNAGPNVSYPYAYGYRTPGNAYRTVMAYSPGTRVPYFSNPDRTHQGLVLGVPIGQAGEAHNSQVINNTRGTIAAFRAATGADYDGSGFLTPADVAAFVTAWLGSVQAGTLAADFDGNGAVEPADVAAFITAWSGAVSLGC